MDIRPRMRRYLPLLVAALAVLVLDQWTKYVAVRDLTDLFVRAEAVTLAERVGLFYREQGIEHLRRPPSDVLPGWRHLYAENPGAAFSFLHDADPGFRRVFFVVVTVLATVFLAALATRVPGARPWLQATLGGILGGVLGNFADRMARGYVIDFIDWYVGDPPRLDWPTFNVADAGITVGVLVLLGRMAHDTITRSRARGTGGTP